MTETCSLPALSKPKRRDYAPHSEPASPSDIPNPLTRVDSSDTDTTATNSSDEFNWDEDDEDSPDSPDRSKAKRFRALWLAFMKLARPIRTLIVGILGAGVLITPLIVVTLKFQSKDIVRRHVHAWSLWLSIVWVAGCLTFLVVDSVPRLIIAIIVLFGGQVERLKTQLELTLAVSAWIKLALDITWAWISLSVIRAFYKPPGNYWPVVNRVLQAMFAAGIILLVEKIFLQYVAINFHERALADRLADNRLGLKALDRLSNAHTTVAKKSVYSRKGHKMTASRTNSVDMLSSLPQSAEGSPVVGQMETDRLTSAVTERYKQSARKGNRKKAMANVIVDSLGGAIGQIALKDSKFNKGGEIGGLYSARRLARKVFGALSYADPPRSHLVVDDFYPYFRTQEEAQDAFALFDKDGNGDITKREMREAVQRIYRERKSLTASLKDVGSIVAKLDAVLLSVALVLIIFICLLIFNRKNTLASLVPLATIILGFSFIFGHSAQTLFESLIFIFSTHVFDVGDLVMIDDNPLFVKEFGLFSTTFRRVDGQEIIAPNSLLASSKLVHNLRRSGSMWETTPLMVSYNTPLEVIEQLRSKIATYVQTNNREWSAFALNIDKMEYQNAIHLVVAMEHKPNWQDWGGRWARRTAFMRNLKTALEELDIKYEMPIQPILLPRVPPPGYGARDYGRDGGGPGSPGGSSREELGNAGTYRMSEYLRVPGMTMREGASSFAG
ncbi:hypothetical protein HGRIS_004666 [Hohenbuehelia grisea]|uniref:EF-hand domain-containing protein n=1 Tax=Hohenbuehelia grisea TaxID=104357 RepID=A0ABR3JD65_9AGAR